MIDRNKYKLDYNKFVEKIITNQTNDKLESLKDYIIEIEFKFKQDMQKINKRYEDEVAATKDIDPENLDRIGEDFSVEYHSIDKIFLRIFRYSIIIMIYSFLENRINDLCNHLHYSRKLTIDIDDLKGSGIDRAKLYLEKVCSIDFPKNKAWYEIEKLNRVRNCIVHAEGDVDGIKSPEKLRNIIKSTKGLELESDRFILIDESYINLIISSSEKILGQLIDKVFQ